MTCGAGDRRGWLDEHGSDVIQPAIPPAGYALAMGLVMRVISTDLRDVLVIEPRRHADERGFFMETFREEWLSRERRGQPFVQDNHSCSLRRGTVRGLHFQRPPMAQGKLVRVVRGRVLDVAVDVREGSASYGRHVAVELSADNALQLWIPPGFLHGFCTLEDDTEVLYKVTAPWSAAHDGAVLWNDPDLGISWPVTAAEAILSAKDAAAPRLADSGLLFPAAENAHPRWTGSP
jgi:dTDP-4-dehydrorhamnose 3,5-epimerase